jgi:hypothetical protein
MNGYIEAALALKEKALRKVTGRKMPEELGGIAVGRSP